MNEARSFVSREVKNRGAVGTKLETLSKKNITWQDIYNSIYIVFNISLTKTVSTFGALSIYCYEQS